MYCVHSSKAKTFAPFFVLPPSGRGPVFCVFVYLPAKVVCRSVVSLWTLRQCAPRQSPVLSFLLDFQVLRASHLQLFPKGGEVVPALLAQVVA